MGSGINRLNDFFNNFDFDPRMLSVNDEKYADMQSQLMDFIDLIDESLADGDIDASKAVLNLENLQRLFVAYKAAMPLASAIKEVEIEIYQNVSFATIIIECEGFGFGALNSKEDSKELYQDFINLVDFYRSSALTPKTIAVSFTINDVWSEQT